MQFVQFFVGDDGFEQSLARSVISLEMSILGFEGDDKFDNIAEKYKCTGEYSMEILPFIPWIGVLCRKH